MNRRNFGLLALLAVLVHGSYSTIRADSSVHAIGVYGGERPDGYKAREKRLNRQRVRALRRAGETIRGRELRAATEQIHARWEEAYFRLQRRMPGEVFVRVAADAGPVTLVLSSQASTAWRVEADSNAVIERIILTSPERKGTISVLGAKSQPKVERYPGHCGERTFHFFDDDREPTTTMEFDPGKGEIVCTTKLQSPQFSALATALDIIRTLTGRIPASVRGVGPNGPRFTVDRTTTGITMYRPPWCTIGDTGLTQAEVRAKRGFE